MPICGAGVGDLALLYGGSVKSGNAREILAVPEVDGALVGGASLDADEFWAIYTAGQEPAEPSAPPPRCNSNATVIRA